MIQSTSATVEEYLTQYGWTYTKGAQGIFFSGWQSKDRSYPLRILIDESFITFQIQPLVMIDTDISAFPELSALLLELNHHHYMAKLSVDDAGDIALSLTLFNDSVNYDQFSHSLGLIAHYADQIHDELANMLNGESLPS